MLRAPAMEQVILHSEQELLSLGHCLHQAKNPKGCVQLLGLSGHPALGPKYRDVSLKYGDRTHYHWYRHPIHDQVIYHADTFSLYQDSAPTLDFWAFDGGGDNRVNTHIDPRERLQARTQIAEDEFFEESDRAMLEANAPVADDIDIECLDDEDETHANPDDFPQDSLASVAAGLRLLTFPALKAHLYSSWAFNAGQSEHQAANIFHVPIPSGGKAPSVFRMTSILRPDTAGEAQMVPLTMDEDGLYFSVVRWKPSRLKRLQPCTEAELSPEMVVISPHRIIKQGSSPIVENEAMKFSGLVEHQTMILSFSSLSMEQLLAMKVYQAKDTVLRYRLKENAELDMTLSKNGCLPELLKLLLDSHSVSGILFEGQQLEEYVDVLSTLIKKGLVQQPDEKNRKHMLTRLGVKSIEVGLELHKPQLAAGLFFFSYRCIFHTILLLVDDSYSYMPTCCLSSPICLQLVHIHVAPQSEPRLSPASSHQWQKALCKGLSKKQKKLPRYAKSTASGFQSLGALL